MSKWASLEPAAATVDPGSSVSIRLRIRNTSDVVEEYRIVPVGELAPYIRVEPDNLRLYPGTDGTAQVALSPPRTPDVPAGPNPFALEITPAEHPDQVAVPEGNLTVTPFHELRAELLPGTVRGRWRGRPHLAVDNLGNTEVTASLRGHDRATDLRYDIRPNTVQIPPGRAAFVRLGLRPSRFLWAGREQKHDYSVDVQRAGAKPVPAQGEYVQPALLAGWLSRLLLLLLALLVAFVALWFGFNPSLRSGAVAKANSSPASAVVVPSAAPPPAKVPAQRPSHRSSSSGESGSAGGNGRSEGRRPTPAVRFAQLQMVHPAGHNCYSGGVTGIVDAPTASALGCYRSQAGYDAQRPEGIDLFSGLGTGDLASLWIQGVTTNNVQPGAKGIPAAQLKLALKWALYPRLSHTDRREILPAQMKNAVAWLEGSRSGYQALASMTVDDQTTAMVKQYQQLENLPVTGSVDDHLLQALTLAQVATN